MEHFALLCRAMPASSRPALQRRQQPASVDDLAFEATESNSSSIASSGQQSTSRWVPHTVRSRLQIANRLSPRRPTPPPWSQSHLVSRRNIIRGGTGDRVSDILNVELGKEVVA
jgi:hypothetical protein